MRARIYWISGITFLGVMLCSGMLYAVTHWEKTQVEKYGSSTLKGLESVSVSVSLLNLSQPAEDPGRRRVQTLAQSDLQTEVELILRSAGIRIHEQSKQSFPAATFFVHVVLMENRCYREHKIYYPPGDPSEPVQYFWRASAKLHQSVALLRQPEIRTFAQTWPLSPMCVRNELNVAGREVVAEAMRKEVGRQVREFTNDYLAANPKEPKKKARSDNNLPWVKVDRDEERQAWRFEFINQMIADVLFTKVEVSGTTVSVWVTPKFMTDDFPYKGLSIAVVYSYHFDGTNDTDDVVILKDSITGETVGEYRRPGGLMMR